MYFFVGIEPARAVDMQPVGATVLDNVTAYEKNAVKSMSHMKL